MLVAGRSRRKAGHCGGGAVAPATGDCCAEHAWRRLEGTALDRAASPQYIKLHYKTMQSSLKHQSEGAYVCACMQLLRTCVCAERKMVKAVTEFPVSKPDAPECTAPCAKRSACSRSNAVVSSHGHLPAAFGGNAWAGQVLGHTGHVIVAVALPIIYGMA